MRETVPGRRICLLQATRDQAADHRLLDNRLSVGLLTWIYEKLHDWSDEYSWTDDEVLTWVSIYYFSTAGPAASQRIYYESTHDPEHNVLKYGKWIPDVKLA